MRAWLVPLVLLLTSCACSDSNDAQPGAGGAGNVGGLGGGGDGGVGGASGGGAVSSGGTPAGGSGGLKPDLQCDHVTVEKSCVDGWCRIPAGCFIMGSPKDEWGRGAYSEDQAKVTLTRSFEIMQYEVTQAEWTAMGLVNPSAPPAEPGHSGDCLEPTCPVGRVNWYEAAAYANLLSEKHAPALQPCYVLSDCTGLVGEGRVCASVAVTAATPYHCEGYRLPTAAEWEYAARAGATTAFYSGPITAQSRTGDCAQDPNLDEIGWYCANSGTVTHPVGQKAPNAWGLYDTAGNTYEMTNDETTGIGHGPGPLVDPDRSSGFSGKVLLRGGGPISYPNACRLAAHFFTVQRGSRAYGFRLVRTLPSQSPSDAGADASTADAGR